MEKLLYACNEYMKHRYQRMLKKYHVIMKGIPWEENVLSFFLSGINLELEIFTQAVRFH